MKKLSGIDFGPIWAMSGLLGFFGEGYWYDCWLSRFVSGFDLGVTFVAKTTTVNGRLGNMPLKQNWRPKEFLPRCIVCNPWQLINGVALNAVSLSGPGAQALLNSGRWQERSGDPFFLSFMSVEQERAKRLGELRGFCELLVSEISKFQAKIGLQINLSCPNVSVGHRDLAEEAKMMLDTIGDFGINIPIVFKLCVATTDVGEAKEIASDSRCSGLCVSNTIPFGHESIAKWRWRYYFPTGKTSPLTRRGFSQAGGLSGAPLLPLTVEWVEKARSHGITCHINGGGGILKPQDVQDMWVAGVDSFSVGSAAFLRPWRLRAIIDRARYLVASS